jgi:hypothetical protein
MIMLCCEECVYLKFSLEGLQKRQVGVTRPPSSLECVESGVDVARTLVETRKAKSERPVAANQESVTTQVAKGAFQVEERKANSEQRKPKRLTCCAPDIEISEL